MVKEEEGKPKYILVYPRTPGISQFFKRAEFPGAAFKPQNSWKFTA